MNHYHNLGIAVDIVKVKAHEISFHDPITIGNHVADILAGSAAKGIKVGPSTHDKRNQITGYVCIECTKSINALLQQQPTRSDLLKNIKIRRT